MKRITLKTTVGAALIALTTQVAIAAGPVAPLSAPSAVVEVKKGRNAAAAAGAIAGAAIMLGILGAANANAAPPAEEYYVEPDDYGYVPPAPGYGDYYDFVLDNPGSAAEVCRRGILKAARPYGARRAVVNRYWNIRDLGDDTVRFRATISVHYPDGVRRSTVVCTVQDGYLIRAAAAR